jgi:hypothetical protein
MNGKWSKGTVYPMAPDICFACERESDENYTVNDKTIIYQRNKAMEGYTIATNNFKKAILKLQEYEMIITKQQEQLNELKIKK